MDSNGIVELVKDLEAEVNNGGFHQYFNNSSGDNAAETVEALETIGALNVAGILKRAISRFEGNNVPKQRSVRLEVLWNKFPETDEFYDLDAEFLAYPDDLSALLLKYKGNA
jgi:hypothetical protein